MLNSRSAKRGSVNQRHTGSELDVFALNRRTLSATDRIFRCVAGLVVIFTVCGFAEPQSTAPESSTHPPYELRVLHEPGLIFLQLTTNEGKINAYVPEGIREGETFSGTMESLGTVSSGTTFYYTMTLAGQSATVKDGAFHWKMPENSGGYMRLRFANMQGEELAVTELRVLRAQEHKEPPLPGAEQLHLPPMIQAESPAPVFGPFDGDSSTTHIEIGGEQLTVLAELPGKAIVAGPRNALGVTSYAIKKGTAEGRGQTRVLHIERKFPHVSQRNGNRGKLHVRVTGLEGLKEDVPLKFEISMPHAGFFEATPPYSYFVSEEQYRFILPKEVGKDGSFTADRNITRLVNGPLDVKANLIIPQDMHELVEIVLRTPRVDVTKSPAQEQAEALKPYGDSVQPVLAEFLTGSLPYEALTVLFLGKDNGAEWVLRYLAWMNGQPLDMAVGVYTEAALKNPDYPYKNDLREAILQLVAGRGSVSAVYALGKLGTPDDLPLLEKVYGETRVAGFEQVNSATDAVLARFGVKENIDHLAKQILTPGPFWSQDVQRGVYADRPELIPALCHHVHDPGAWYGDYGVYPGESAKAAIRAIQHKPLTDDQIEAVCKGVTP